MHDDWTLIEGRLRRMVGRLADHIYPARVPLDIAAWVVPGEPVPPADAFAAEFEAARVGDRWGAPWSTVWFRLTGRVPREWAGKTVEVIVDLGFDHDRTGFQAEGLVYGHDGRPLKGLHPGSRWVRLGSGVTGGESVGLYVEAAANPLVMAGFRPTSLGDKETAGTAPLYELRQADLAVFDEPVWNLVQDLEVLGQLAAELHRDDARRFAILRAVDRALDRITMDEVAVTASAAREELAPIWKAPARSDAHRVSAVGHAHIDSAWLWPTRESVRKVARTVANVLDLMDTHPELKYAMSSAQQYAWLQQHQPVLFERLKEKIRSGQFVPVGGMWVESDVNMPGGEALARQFAYGKRYFHDVLGVETEEVWLPDSFGYSAALPQLIALSGSRWFLTQKLSWNQTNQFPHHTFWWEGIDGTRVFSHFPPVATYNSDLSGRDLARAARNFAEKGHATCSLVPFGHGDGGGGPTREMLARADRLRDLDGSPRVTVESPAQFFTRAEAEYPNAPVWSGELYLEYHRGTYTSQARTKQGNRRCEHLLREAELWCATAAVRHGTPYPYEALERIWQVVLLQQFHDILPGSSIAWVHREAVANYASAMRELEQLIDAALAVLAGEGARPLSFNAAPHPWRGVPAMGAAVADDLPATQCTADGGGFVLTSGERRARIDARGLVTSITDGSREVIAPGGAGNLLQLHPDTPNAWDAWDIDAFYRHIRTDLVGVTDLVAERGGVHVQRRFGASTIDQTIAWCDGVLRFDCEIDWHEREKLLKAAFDLDVAADRSAAETQFGHVHRPTHTNTTWDAAKFEICAHRWLHVGEAGYGVALVNDSTYGHDVVRRPRAGGGISTLARLSLLRAPRFPDPETDQGAHRLAYALVPGAADIRVAVREGYRMNLPLRRVDGAAPVTPLVEVDGAVVESVKLADDRSGDVVVRLYEARGGRADVSVRTDFAATRVDAVDLLERPLHAVADLRLTLRPFQILTLRFRR